MTPAWKSDNGKYYDSELEAAKADAEYWRKKYEAPSCDSEEMYPSSGRGDAVG